MLKGSLKEHFKGFFHGVSANCQVSYQGVRFLNVPLCRFAWLVLLKKRVKLDQFTDKDIFNVFIYVWIK